MTQPTPDDPRPPIAAAIIVQGGRVLLVQRRVKEGSLSWQFPAGEVEQNESAGAAAVREAKEETGLTVAETRILGERIHPNTGRTIIYVACNIIEGVASIADDDELVTLAWSNHEQLAHYVPHGFLSAVQNYLDAALKS